MRTVFVAIASFSAYFIFRVGIGRLEKVAWRQVAGTALLFLMCPYGNLECCCIFNPSPSSELDISFRFCDDFLNPENSPVWSKLRKMFNALFHSYCCSGISLQDQKIDYKLELGNTIWVGHSEALNKTWFLHSFLCRISVKLKKKSSLKETGNSVPCCHIYNLQHHWRVNRWSLPSESSMALQRPCSILTLFLFLFYTVLFSWFIVLKATLLLNLLLDTIVCICLFFFISIFIAEKLCSFWLRSLFSLIVHFQFVI